MARTVGAYSTVAQAPRLQQVWQSMRVMRRFTTADLLVTAEAGESQVHKYCRALARAGYLRLVLPRVSGRPGSRDLWILTRDSGPAAPIRRKDGSGVFDPNTGAVWAMLPLPRPAKLRDCQRDPTAPRDLGSPHPAAEQSARHD